MPPATRRTKAAKNVKENIDENIYKTKLKNNGKATKVVRKPLTDKTNSASDENESLDMKNNPKTKKLTSNCDSQMVDASRPRRDKRLPSRFIENQMLGNCSINKKSAECHEQNIQRSAKNVPKKTSDVIITKSSVKTPPTNKEKLLSPPELKNFVENRPKRIPRLPAKFDDHSLSPNKFIPLQPCFASTPISNKNRAQNKIITTVIKTSNKKVNYVKRQTSKVDDVLRNKDATNSSDNNNNADCDRLLRTKKLNNTNFSKSPPKTNLNKNLKKNSEKRLLNLNFSFKVLEEKVQSPKDSKEKLAVYDFTFDPNEEPAPQKKKRKRVVKKKPAPKSKVTLVSNNYDANIAKSLQMLKNAVAKPANGGDGKNVVYLEITDKQPVPVKTTVIASDSTQSNTTKETPVDNIENIVEDFNDHINYSPITAPNHPEKPQVKISAINETRDQLYARARSTILPDNPLRDPLNLLDELSFCDEVPIASSSMNTSVRHPLASPWRVEYSNLPIKWQDNTYVKPNMTPAVESSFISSLEQKNKHVYTNIVAENNEMLPEIVTIDNETCKWKQTSIISFIREAAERSANKKLCKLKKTTPKKSSIAENNMSNESITAISDTVNCSKNVSNDKENSGDHRTPTKRKGDVLVTDVPAKSPHIENKTKDKFFGFDVSEDQENVSPEKKYNCGRRALRPRARAALKEINKTTGPSRAQLPSKTKFATNSEVINKLFNEMKTASVPPECPASETVAEKGPEVSTTSDPSWHESMEERNDEQQSLHLFEDIDVVHHIKPQRKSYGNAKKMTFCQKTMNTESQLDIHDNSDEEDPDDLPFQMPTIKIKKVAPKKKKKGIKLTKKEEEEVEAWAAAFNSMCEDVDEFTLVVE